MRMGGVVAAASAICLSVALAFAGRPLFPFVPEAEIRRQPDVIAPLSHIAGRVLTAHELSALAKVAAATVTRARHGHPITPRTLSKLATALTGVPVVPGASDLLGGV